MLYAILCYHDEDTVGSWTAEQDAAGDGRCRGQQPEGGETEDALAGARLADEADDLAARQLERHSAQRPKRSTAPAEGHVQVAHRGEDGSRPPGDLLALLGQLDARLPPLDQADLQLVLELLDLHAERRLADGTGLSGMAEMARFRQGFEVAQLSQRNHADKAPLSFL